MCNSEKSVFVGSLPVCRNETYTLTLWLQFLCSMTHTILTNVRSFPTLEHVTSHNFKDNLKSI